MLHPRPARRRISPVAVAALLLALATGACGARSAAVPEQPRGDTPLQALHRGAVVEVGEAAYVSIIQGTPRAQLQLIYPATDAQVLRLEAGRHTLSDVSTTAAARGTGAWRNPCLPGETPVSAPERGVASPAHPGFRVIFTRTGDRVLCMRPADGPGDPGHGAYAVLIASEEPIPPARWDAMIERVETRAFPWTPRDRLGLLVEALEAEGVRFEARLVAMEHRLLLPPR